MQLDTASVRKMLSDDLTNVLIRVGLIAFVVVLCVRIFSPFLGLMVWALILAVTLNPLCKKLAGRLGWRQARAATAIVLMGLLLLGAPTVMLGSSFAGEIFDTYKAFENNEIKVSQPNPKIAEWPLVGKRLYEAWQSAANDLPAFLEKMQPQLSEITGKLLSAAAGTAGTLLQFLGALIIAGIMMAYHESGNNAMIKIFTRLSGPRKGPELHKLSTATVRSVASGVVGVAFIQALLLGIGFVVAGIPMAGLLAGIVMLLGIAQLPALVVSLPAIAYLWWSGDSSTVLNIVFTVYLLLAGMADNVLKPLLLGRGVDAPMPIILLGAIGGMVTSGIIGLFIGAVVLAVGYQIFMDWVDDEGEDVTTTPEQNEVGEKA